MTAHDFARKDLLISYQGMNALHIINENKIAATRRKKNTEEMKSLIYDRYLLQGNINAIRNLLKFKG